MAVVSLGRASGKRGEMFALEVKGYSETLKNLELMKDQKAVLQKFLEKEAENVRRMAVATCPEDKGRLKDSHRVLTFGAAKRNFVRADVVVGGKVVRGRMVNYAEAVHEGYRQFVFGRDINKKVPGRPWLRDALERNSKGFRERLGKAVKIPKAQLARFK